MSDLIPMPMRGCWPTRGLAATAAPAGMVAAHDLGWGDAWPGPDVVLVALPADLVEAIVTELGIAANTIETLDGSPDLVESLRQTAATIALPPALIGGAEA